MARIRKDVFSENPYAPPEFPEAVLIDELSPRARNYGLKRLVLLLAFATAVETGMTLLMTTLHGSSPRIRGINVYAVTHLFITGMFAMCISWVTGMRRSVLASHLTSQTGNMLIWGALVVTLIYVSGMPVRGAEVWVFFAGFGISAVLCLLATSLSLRVQRQSRRRIPESGPISPERV